MLNDNIRQMRKSKGLSQEELAIRLNVVRQTVSKWENGLSVPDSVMLISLADALDTTVSDLLGSPVSESPADDIKTISEKLEVINLQLARQHMAKIRAIRLILIALCILTAAIFAGLLMINGSYMDWNYNDPENAIAGTFLHGFEFLFVRIAPFVLLGSVIGIALTFRKN